VATTRAVPLPSCSPSHGRSANEVPTGVYRCFATGGAPAPRLPWSPLRGAIRGRVATRHYSPAPVGSSEVVQLWTILASGLVGLVVGSFLNVVVYRLPLGMSVVEPPSRCPSCETRLTVVDLVPVLSWLWLRGKCRHCGAHIAARYPLVELSSGLLCAAVAGTLGSVVPLPSVAVVALCALGASLVDADGGAVPLAFALVGALAAVSLLPIAVVVGHADRLIWAALGLVLGFLGAFVGDHADGSARWTRIGLLACLAWTAGWLWPGGGAFVAAWIVVATAATGLGAARRAPFAMLAAGAVVAVLGSALISRP
jgi:leader peptidase (prepilin peptidase) / N-methyltransferase